MDKIQSVGQHLPRSGSVLLYIRKKRLPEFIKIAITYLKYNEFSYIGKIHEAGTPSNLGLILKHIVNITEIHVIPIYQLWGGSLWHLTIDFRKGRVKNE